MEIKELQSWDDFEEIELKKLIEYRNAIKTKNNLHNPDILVFRGQRSSEWFLKTTLERHTSKIPNDQYPWSDYFELIKKARSEIQSIPTAIHWEILDSPEYSNWYEHRNFLWPHGLLDYMVFLRHHEFPSPYLDWTTSTDVAAYFAFQDVDLNVNKSVAIFAFLDTSTGTKGIRPAEPNIKRVRLEALIEERHKRQNSTYTYCSTESKEGEYYSGHEKVFMGNRKTKHQQDALWKYIIPSSEKEKVIEKLKSKSINAFSILPMGENHQNAEFFQNLFRELGG
jgi:hypothetical protein